jgi:hypothetical protein
MRRPRAGAGLQDRQQERWPIRLATVVAVAIAAWTPLLQLYRIATTPVDQGRAGWVVAAATLLSMPVQVWLVWSAARAVWQPQLVIYFILGVLVVAATLAVMMWLARAARHLEAARAMLAQQAVIGERLRIDGELRQTVGAALEAIAVRGKRAGALATSDPQGAARELHDLVGAARQTLTTARQLVTRYQEVPLHAELEATAALLAAAGIQAHLALPPERLPDRLDAAGRAMLRRDLARLLGQEPARSAVTITITRRDGGIQVELRPGGADPAAAEATAR